MNEKAPKCMCMPNVLVLLSQPGRTYWSLTVELERVVIEVSTVQVRGNSKLYWCFWSGGFPCYAWVGVPSATQFAMKTEVVASISKHSKT